MIDIGVQTKGILPERSVDFGVQMISEAGFDRVDFNLDTFLKNTDVYGGNINKFFDKSEEELIEFFRPYKEVFDKYDLHPSQMHAPYPVWVIGKPQVGEYMEEKAIPKSFFVANYLEIPWMVVHPIKAQLYRGLEIERQMNIEYFQTLIPYAKKYKVGVCVENLYESIGPNIIEGVCANPDDAIYYVDSMNELAGEELFGVCLDTGHMELTHRKCEDYIRAMGDRLKILHMHENDAVGDLHQMPFTFGRCEEDGVNWGEFAKALHEIGFDGTLSFETFPTMNSFPNSTKEQVLKTIYDIGCYIRKMIEES